MTNGKRVTFTVGIGYDKDGKPFGPYTLDTKINQIKKEAATSFGGFSLTRVDGGWVDDTGKYIAEPSLRFEVIVGVDKLRFIEPFAVYLRLGLNQTSVLVTVENVNFEFVVAEGVENAA